VTFTNSYAMKDTISIFYFRAMVWDELQVVLPTGEDPYPMIDAIRRAC